jgi:hypothetical protein
MSDGDEDFDSIFASKGNHASIYSAISQAPSVAVISLFFYFQLTLLSYGYLSLLHKRNGVKRKRKGLVQRNRSTVIQFIRSWDDTMFRRQFRMCREDFCE